MTTARVAFGPTAGTRLISVRWTQPACRLTLNSVVPRPRETLRGLRREALRLWPAWQNCPANARNEQKEQDGPKDRPDEKDQGHGPYATPPATPPADYDDDKHPPDGKREHDEDYDRLSTRD